MEKIVSCCCVPGSWVFSNLATISATGLPCSCKPFKPMPFTEFYSSIFVPAKCKVIASYLPNGNKPVYKEYIHIQDLVLIVKCHSRNDFLTFNLMPSTRKVHHCF